MHCVQSWLGNSQGLGDHANCEDTDVTTTPFAEYMHLREIADCATLNEHLSCHINSWKLATASSPNRQHMLPE